MDVRFSLHMIIVDALRLRHETVCIGHYKAPLNKNALLPSTVLSVRVDKICTINWTNDSNGVAYGV